MNHQDDGNLRPGRFKISAGMSIHPPGPAGSTDYPAMAARREMPLAHFAGNGEER